MSKTIVGLFNDRKSAEDATYELRKQGFSMENVSILTKNGTDNYDNSTDQVVNDNISDGVTTGSVLGGLAGLLIGAGTFAVPGLGMIAAAGPIAGLISGAVTGGVVGGLVDLGVPEDQSRVYENNIKTGKVLLSVKTDQPNINAITNIMTNYRATEVNVY